MKRTVFYLRVSTIEQTTANQERELREGAGRMGWYIVKVYKVHGIFPQRAVRPRGLVRSIPQPCTIRITRHADRLRELVLAHGDPVQEFFLQNLAGMGIAKLRHNHILHFCLEPHAPRAATMPMLPRRRAA
jgi:hypothetical protein